MTEPYGPCVASWGRSEDPWISPPGSAQQPSEPVWCARTGIATASLADIVSHDDPASGLCLRAAGRRGSVVSGAFELRAARSPAWGAHSALTAPYTNPGGIRFWALPTSSATEAPVGQRCGRFIRGEKVGPSVRRDCVSR